MSLVFLKNSTLFVFQFSENVIFCLGCCSFNNNNLPKKCRVLFSRKNNYDEIALKCVASYMVFGKFLYLNNYKVQIVALGKKKPDNFLNISCYFFVKTLTFTLIYFMLYLFQISIWTFHCNFIVVFVSHCRRFMSLKIEICFWMTFRKKKSQRLQTQNWKISNMIRDEKCSVENGILRTLVSYRNFLTSPSWSITPRTLNVFTRIGSRQGDRTTDILLDTWIWLCF